MGGFRLTLAAALVVTLGFAGFSASAARARLPQDGPIPSMNPVAAAEMKAATERAAAAVRQILRVGKRAGKSLGKIARPNTGSQAGTARAGLPQKAPVPAFNPVATDQRDARNLAEPHEDKLTAIARQGVTIRAGAGRKSKEVGTLAAGSAVDVLRCNRNWCEFRHGKATAWAARQYLDLKGNDAEAAATTPPGARDAAKVVGSPTAAAAGLTEPMTAEQARAAAKRSTAAAGKVVVWAARAAKALGKVAAAEAGMAQRKNGKPREAAEAGPAAAKPQSPRPERSRSFAPLVAHEGTVPMPADEVACRARLRAAEVRFVEEKPLGDPLGCAAPYPIRLMDLGPDFGITPDAVLNCRMAEAAVNFTRDTIAPAAVLEFETRVKSLRHASAYVCRPRNGSERLSEHAFGNALDISAFILEDGSEIPVDATREHSRSIFLSKVRSAACGPFKTVLGPGSDADHALHFHFDMAQRRRGGTFCQ